MAWWWGGLVGVVARLAGGAARWWNWSVGSVAGRAQEGWQEGGSGEGIFEILRSAENGVAAPDPVAARLTGPRAVAQAVRVRSTRASRTVSAHTAAVRQLRAFLEVNPSLTRHLSHPVTQEEWDVMLEAFVTARVNAEDTHEFQRPSDWGRVEVATAGKYERNARSGLTRFGWITGPCTRTMAAKKALGCGDPEDVMHATPIFAWEVCEGARTARPSNPWEKAAWALVTVGLLAGARVGSSSTLLLGQVQFASADVAVLTPRTRQKQDKARATGRPRRAARPVAVKHWLVTKFLRPWVRWLRLKGFPPSTYLFPSLVRARSARAKTNVGILTDGDLWLEPVRRWSPRAVIAALDLVLRGNRHGRTFHGLRGGNNREMRRMFPKVSDVTRRLLHGRTVRDLVGSEDAYLDVFLEDFTEATRNLGALRIELVQGLYQVTASSLSAAEEDDWTPVASLGAATRGGKGDDEEASDQDKASESSGDDDRSSVGSVPSDAASYDCGRCTTHVARSDYGYLCQRQDCHWGVCTACFIPKSANDSIWCQEHRGSQA